MDFLRFYHLHRMGLAALNGTVAAVAGQRLLSQLNQCGAQKNQSLAVAVHKRSMDMHQEVELLPPTWHGLA